MSHPCPACCEFPKMCRGKAWPQLGPEINGLRYCEVCSKWYDKSGEESSFDAPANNDPDYTDPSNPGQHQKTKIWYPSVSDSVKWYIKRYIRMNCSRSMERYSERGRLAEAIYFIAGRCDVRPGEVRLIWEEMLKENII